MIDEQGWEKVCFSFFRDRDEVARQAIESFEYHQAFPATATDDKQDAASKKRKSKDSDQVTSNELLNSLGMADPFSLSPEQLKKCIEIKNAARRQVHLEVLD